MFRPVIRRVAHNAIMRARARLGLRGYSYEEEELAKRLRVDHSKLTREERLLYESDGYVPKRLSPFWTRVKNTLRYSLIGYSFLGYLWFKIYSKEYEDPEANRTHDLKPLGTGLWFYRRLYQSLFLIPHVTASNMFVCVVDEDSDDGPGLMIYNPTRLTKVVIHDIRNLKKKLGDMPVKYICLPSSNSYTYYLDDYLKAFPDSVGLVPEGMGKKFKNIESPIKEISKDSPDVPGGIEVRRLKGFWWIDELVFKHKMSDTLVVRDFVHHVCRDTIILRHHDAVTGPLMDTYAWMFGFWDNIGVDSNYWWILRNRSQAEESIKDILTLDFTGVAMAFGEPVPALLYPQNIMKKVVRHGWNRLLNKDLAPPEEKALDNAA